MARFKTDFREFVPGEVLEQIAPEVAGCQIYLAVLSDRLGIDIGPAAARRDRLRDGRSYEGQAPGDISEMQPRCDR